MCFFKFSLSLSPSLIHLNSPPQQNSVSMHLSVFSVTYEVEVVVGEL